MNRAFWLSAVSVLALAACADAPGPQGSGIAPPSFWSRIIGSSGPCALAAPLAGGPQVQVQHDWWKRFNDPTLDALLTEALANNKTLAIAKARVEEARANRGAARARQLPQIGIAADASRGAVVRHELAERLVALPRLELALARAVVHDLAAAARAAGWCTARRVVAGRHSGGGSRWGGSVDSGLSAPRLSVVARGDDVRERSGEAWKRERGRSAAAFLGAVS